MGQRESKNTFFGGAAILAVGIAVVKLIGAIYKIPLGNILGDEGYGHFNNAYVIYNLLLMISTAGLPVALSKTISEANAQGRRNQVHRVFNVALAAFLVLGTVTALVMFLLAQPLADLQGDGMAAQAVRAIAPACFFVCVLSAFRGYAQGHSNMVPTSVSQIIEALGKLGVGLALAWLLVSRGASSADSAAGAIFGVTVGAAVSLLFLIVNHIGLRRGEGGRLDDRPEPHGVILKKLLVIAVPITLCASVSPITSWIDTAQVQNILRETMNAQPAQYYHDMGLVDPVVSAYGAYQKALTIYNLPAAFMVALTASVVPAISACLVRRDKTGAGRIGESALRIGMLLSIPAGIGLTVLAGPIMHRLYASADHTITDPAMTILGIASIFVCIMLICNAILQANGFVTLPIFIMILGCGTLLVVDNVLVRRIGIVGAPIATLSCYLVVAVLELALVKRVVPSSPKYRRVFPKPLAAALVMGAAVWAVSGLLEKALGLTLTLVVSIGVGIVIYLILVLALRAISKEDLALMPKGDKIAKILRL